MTKDVQVSVADYGIETLDENLASYSAVGEPDEHTTIDTQTIIENGVPVIRK